MAIENVMAVRKGKVIGPPSSVGPTWADNNASGSKNLIPYPWEQPTESTTGLSWTDNGDGTFTVNGSVTSGKSNGAIRWRDKWEDYILPAGEYWLSGCPAGGTEYTTAANTTYYVWLNVYHSDGTQTEYHEIGNGKKVTILDDDLYLRGGIDVFEGAGTVSNLTFKPMLRRIEDPDNTYEPSGLSNQQLSLMLGSAKRWTRLLSATVKNTTTEYSFDNSKYTTFVVQITSANSHGICHTINKNMAYGNTNMTLIGYNLTNNSAMGIHVNLQTGKVKGQTLTSYDQQYGIQVYVYGIC